MVSVNPVLCNSVSIKPFKAQRPDEILQQRNLHLYAWDSLSRSNPIPFARPYGTFSTEISTGSLMNPY